MSLAGYCIPLMLGNIHSLEHLTSGMHSYEQPLTHKDRSDSYSEIAALGKLYLSLCRDGMRKEIV